MRLLRTGTFISLRLLSHFLSCFLSTCPFLFIFLPTSFPTSGRLVGREVRPVRLERGILGVEVDQSAGCHPPTHLFDPFLQPRREDSAAHTVQPASPVSSDERGEGQFRWKPQGFCWEYSSGVALALIALESRACVPLLDSLEGGEPRS